MDANDNAGILNKRGALAFFLEQARSHRKPTVIAPSTSRCPGSGFCIF